MDSLLKGNSKRDLLIRLVMADLLARPGEGPLAPRFGPVRGAPPPAPPPRREPERASDE